MASVRQAVVARVARAYSIAAVMVAVAAVTTGIGAPSTATLQIGINPGNPIAIDVTPEAYAVSNDGRPVCVVVVVKTALYGWSLAASYYADQAIPVNVILAPAPGSSCTTAGGPGAAAHLSAGSRATLLSHQRGTAMAAYVVLVRSTARLATPIRMTLAFTAEAPGARAVQSAVALALDAAGDVAVMTP